ncbi:hypothetical protein FB451DRAFT_1490889 [Mycena latifolia]|nr:hypothetical protein FB451DRAFT_1490889 [Mycena latifolia]
MFSQMLALGLAAVALANAAPSVQTAMISCSVDAGAPVGTPKFTMLSGPIAPGIYNIWTAELPNMLRSGHYLNEATFVSGNPDGPYSEGRAQDRHFEFERIHDFNVALETPAFANLQDEIICGLPPGGPGFVDSFTITPQGSWEYPNLYRISVPNRNRVWAYHDSPPAFSWVKIVDENDEDPKQYWVEFVPVPDSA